MNRVSGRGQTVPCRDLGMEQADGDSLLPIGDFHLLGLRFPHLCVDCGSLEKLPTPHPQLQVFWPEVLSTQQVVTVYGGSGSCLIHEGSAHQGLVAVVPLLTFPESGRWSDPSFTMGRTLRLCWTLAILLPHLGVKTCLLVFLFHFWFIIMFILFSHPPFEF